MPYTLTRSLLVILMPGAIVITPWVMFLLIKIELLSTILTNNKVELGIFVFIFSTVAGGILEGVNTLIELQLDRCRTRCRINVTSDWYHYLCFARKENPVAIRYISSRAVAMHFELSLAWAMPISTYGFVLILKSQSIENLNFCLFVISSWILSGFFFWQGVLTHGVLCKVRNELRKSDLKALEKEIEPATSAGKS